VVPAITEANVDPFTVIASASKVPSISTSPDISKLAVERVLVFPLKDIVVSLQAC
jgi:hypothetical protein